MKYTLCITQRCNLACGYCYIEKKNSRMSLDIARKVIDFVFSNTPPQDKIDIGFFGGEPLLEFDIIKDTTTMIETHPSFDDTRVELTVVTNGTVFSRTIGEFLNRHNIGYCVSYDGLPQVHDIFRTFPDGTGSSFIVENTIKLAREVLPSVLVNAVYHPDTFHYLPQVVEHLSSLGLRQIYLNPDFSAQWSKREAEMLSRIYSRIAELYVDYYMNDNPHFISLIDSKIAVILRGGYTPLERCRMGEGEFAFTPDGNIYPCERLIGAGGDNSHCIGNIYEGLKWEKLACRKIATESVNRECMNCGLKNYCMNWCGCSNFFSSGRYNVVSPFLCVSEQMAIQAAFHVFRTLEERLGGAFTEHL
jgi:uncharacterized protein